MAHGPASESGDLQKGLRQRHLTMIAIGGVIGAGLFVGSGAIIGEVGPAAFLTYAITGVLIVMVEVGLLPTWIVATILIRELIVQGVRQVAAAANVVIAARALGKSKTLITLVAMAVLLLAFDGRSGGPMAGIGSQAVDALAVGGLWLMVLATALTVVSGLDYLRGAAPVLLGHDRDVG